MSYDLYLKYGAYGRRAAELRQMELDLADEDDAEDIPLSAPLRITPSKSRPSPLDYFNDKLFK